MCMPYQVTRVSSIVPFNHVAETQLLVCTCRWYLPARYYATTIGSGPTAINLVVFNSDPLIDSYKVVSPSNSYGLVDEMIATESIERCLASAHASH